MPKESTSPIRESYSCEPFYITGLPRTRTAWLSVLMSDYVQMVCFHEPLARMKNLSTDAVRAKLRSLGWRRGGVHYVGVSDSSLPLLAPNLPLEYPGPVLVILREPLEVIDSLTAYFGDDRTSRDEMAAGVSVLHAALDKFMHQVPHEAVTFSQLADTKVLKAICRYLTPDAYQFPSGGRITDLQRLRIDPLPTRLGDGLTDTALTTGVIETGKIFSGS